MYTVIEIMAALAVALSGNCPFQVKVLPGNDLDIGVDTI